MTTYNTGNPVPSADARDRYDNSQTLDEVVNGESASYTTRTGKQVISLGGMNSRFNNAQNEREVEFNLSQEEKQEAFQSFLDGSGWSSIGAYGAGVAITSHTQTVDYLGQPYSLKPSIPASLDAPYVTTGAWATEGVNFKLVGDNSLRQDLATASQGTNIVSHAPNVAGADSITANQAISDILYNAAYGGASMLLTDNAPAIRKAWMACPEGQTVLIASPLRIAQTLRLPKRNVNLRCDAPIIVADGTWDGVVFDGAPDITLPGTALVSLMKGDTKLTFVGAPPVTDPENFFFTIETGEVYNNRVGQEDYVSYTKNEAHAIMSYDWSLSDPILYDHPDLSLATLQLTRKSKPTTIRLKIVAEASTNRAARNLWRNLSQSNIHFVDPDIDSANANRFGTGLGNSKCFNLKFTRPLINGFNVTGTQGQISYPVANYLSSFLTFEGFKSIQTKDPLGSKLPRSSIDHHCNFVVFKDCDLTSGTDAHIGSNYYILGGTMTREGVSFVGTNLTLSNVKASGAGGDKSLVAIRVDSPYCHGKLTIHNCDMPGDWLALFATTSTLGDPLGRTAKFKAFDVIDIDGLDIAEGLQSFDSIVNLSGARNTAVFTVVEKTTLVSMRKIRVAGEMLNSSQAFLRLGDASITTAAAPTFIADTVILDGVLLNKDGRLGTATYVGDIRFGPCAIGKMIVKNCRGISMSRIRGITDLEISESSTNKYGDMFFAQFDNVNVLLDRVEINTPLNAATAGATGAPKFILIDNTFNAIGQVQNGSIVRGQGNVVAFSQTIPSFYTGKLANFIDPAVYKTS